MLVIHKVWQKILGMLFPTICISCLGYLRTEESEKMLCGKCFDSIEILEEIPEAQVHAVGLYSSKPLRDLIHGLKFKRYIKAMDQIEELIQRYIEKNPNSILKKYDLITFIPLHPARQRVRGFNQAELIAKVLGDKLNIEVLPTLKKVKNIKEQSLIKDYELRANNVTGCFELINPILNNKKIILVDDVYTSGATTMEALRVLNAAENDEITIFVLAKTS